MKNKAEKFKSQIANLKDDILQEIKKVLTEHKGKVQLYDVPDCAYIEFYNGKFNMYDLCQVIDIELNDNNVLILTIVDNDEEEEYIIVEDDKYAEFPHTPDELYWIYNAICQALEID